MTPGSIGWIDLTTPNAGAVRDFYSAVAGWKADAVPMKDGDEAYADYIMMHPDSSQPVAGVCHLRGSNAAMPPGWMIYIIVASLDDALAQVAAHGGKQLGETRSMGGASRFAVIEDPGGARCGLFQP